MSIQENSRLRSRRLKWIHACNAIVIALLGGMMSTEAQGITPVAIPTIFENLSVDELLSVYKQAYLDAGFELKEQTTRTDKWKRDRTHLVFEFSIPEYPLKKKGMVSFNIDSSSLDPNCAPCSVYGEVFGGEIFGSTEYSSEEWAIFLPKMIAADKKAMAQIKIKLGKNIRSAPPDGRYIYDQ